MGATLEGRKAVVTGASSGIGEATALAFADAGATVALGARRKDRLEDLAGRIGSAGGSAHVFEVDVGDEAAARSFIEGAAEQMGGLDILINNAGVMLLGPVEGADTEEWRQMINVNVLGLLYCTQAAMPLIRDGGGGDIVNISSVAGRQAALGAGVYNLTKFGVNAFSESLRQEVTANHVRVSIVEPGAVKTELWSHVRPEIRAQGSPFDKIERLEAEDIADAIAYIVTRPRREAVNEVLIRPTEQEN